MTSLLESAGDLICKRLRRLWIFDASGNWDRSKKFGELRGREHCRWHKEEKFAKKTREEEPSPCH